MSEINILSPHVADLIAAGEVVERPASVIKELLENAFDAGAQTVTAEIRGGGMTYIRVTDDGSGMLPEDAGLCFTRHATSKLHDARGLESIGTMGFRGEALAAIAAVSRIELITRRRGTDTGTRLLLEAGEIQELSPHGCPEGTTLIVRDLFFNTPARLKFMKADKAESAACTALALRCALGRPERSVRLIRDGAEEFFSPGDGKADSCAYSLLGREHAKTLLPCAGEDEGLAVSGFVGSPQSGHGSRARQFFFCNGRSIKSQLLQAAVEQAYKNTLLTGRYPACVIYLTLSFGAVDVNVHPAKTEVKFRDERRVFDVVYFAALSALEKESPAAELTLPAQPKTAAIPQRDFFKAMGASEFREKYGQIGKPVPAASSHPVVPERGTLVWNRTPTAGAVTSLRESATPYRIAAPMPAHEAAPPFDAASPPEQEAQRAPEAPAHALMDSARGGWRLIGEAMKTYILVEQEDTLLLIDKHAAHERLLFDRLKKQEHEILSQTLLVPVTLRLTEDAVALLENAAEILERLGFEIDPFGADSVIIRSVPDGTAASDAAALVEELCEKLARISPLSPGDALDSILHTVACKAAIKAGWHTESAELEELVRAVVSGEVKYCPHGRPVATTLTRAQLDKAFSRIV